MTREDAIKIQEIEKILNECCNTYDEKGNHIGNKCSHCECWDDTNNLCCSYNSKQAIVLYDAGYRKVKQGKWIYDFGWKCSDCGWKQSPEFDSVPNDMLEHCPHCCAIME